MMKLVYRVYLVTLISLMSALLVSAQTPGPTPRASTPTVNTSNARSAKDPRNTAPTVGTGGPVGGPTGLFTVYDGQTLRKGEFTFSGAYSNFDRDPGNADIVEVPVSFQVGLTNRIELFFNTDAYRAVKVNSPTNLSGFYLPNSRLNFNGVVASAPAIVLAPGTGGPFFNLPTFRPAGTAPFVQFPFTGGSFGNLGFTGTFFSGPQFGFPAGSVAVLGPPRTGGNGADNFPGVGSVFGSILPGIVFQVACAGNTATCPASSTVPTVFTLAPSYLNDAPFINRTYGESSFNTFTGGVKWRFTGLDNPVGIGVVAWYKWFADRAGDFSGFNQLQRGASPGGNRGDIGVTLFADARLRRWANLSANVGYVYTSNPKADGFTLLDRGDELQSAIGVDFPINKYFQPIFEIRSLKYVGGRTPNAFENDPIDALAGLRIFPTRWAGFGFAYRYHANEQDLESFDQERSFTTNVAIPCIPANTPNCTTRNISTTFTGVPPGFQISQDPHGYIIQAFVGRRNKRAEDIINLPANVTNLTVSDSQVYLPCPPGQVPGEGQTCADNTQLSVTTTAVDPENDILTYNYTVNGGRVVGTGANVTWDVGGLAPGTYTITAGVDDGCGLCGKTMTQTITVAECPGCHIRCECPTLTVTGPAGITNPGDLMTFTANVSGGSQSTVTYNWSVSEGTIESGQGTPSITVRAPSNATGGNVVATVTLGGFDTGCDCARPVSETAPYAQVAQPVLVNEFSKMSNDDIRAQLDNFFAELANNPNNQGYIINYGTDKEITARERLITNHIAFRKFDRTRITLIRGGTSPDGIVHTKLYRIPPGAENPAP